MPTFYPDSTVFDRDSKFLLSVNCEWDEWSTWTTCSRSCGSGTKKRNRNVSMWQLHGGYPCPGTKTSIVMNIGVEEVAENP